MGKILIAVRKPCLEEYLQQVIEKHMDFEVVTSNVGEAWAKTAAYSDIALAVLSAGSSEINVQGIREAWRIQIQLSVPTIIVTGRWKGYIEQSLKRYRFVPYGIVQDSENADGFVRAIGTAIAKSRGAELEPAGF